MSPRRDLALRPPCRCARVYGFVGVALSSDLLEVEDDVGDVLDDVGDGGELVQRAVDLHGGDGRALQRRQQHAAQRVAERDAEAALERLAGELAVGLGERLARPRASAGGSDRASSCAMNVGRGRCHVLSPAVGRFHHVRACSNAEPSRPLASETRRRLLRVELDDELLVDRQREVLAGRQLRRLAPLKLSLSSSSHCGTPRRSTASSALDDARHLLRRLADLDRVARLHEERRDVDPLAVDREVAVADQLARLGVVGREAQR